MHDDDLRNWIGLIGVLLYVILAAYIVSLYPD